MGLFDVPSADDARMVGIIGPEFLAAAKHILDSKGGTYDYQPRRRVARLLISPRDPLTNEEKKALRGLADALSAKHGGYRIELVYR